MNRMLYLVGYVAGLLLLLGCAATQQQRAEVVSVDAPERATPAPVWTETQRADDGTEWLVHAHQKTAGGDSLSLLERRPSNAEQDAEGLPASDWWLLLTRGDARPGLQAPTWKLATYPASLSSLPEFAGATIEGVPGASTDLYAVSLSWRIGEDFASIETHVFLYTVDASVPVVQERMHSQLSASSEMDTCVSQEFFAFEANSSGQVRYIVTRQTTYAPENDPDGTIECTPSAAESTVTVIDIP